jgi:hypothetical protein
MKHRPHVIALAGPDRVGKSTTARVIVEQRPRHALVESFAWPIHETLSRMGLGPWRERKAEPILGIGKSYRDLCIALGQTQREILGQHIYTDRLREQIEGCRRQRDNDWLMVIDDLRQPSEAQMVHAQGGVVIELRRDGVIKYSGHDLDQRLPPTLIDASIPLLSDPQEAAAHILRLTGWVA